MIAMRRFRRSRRRGMSAMIPMRRLRLLFLLIYLVAGLLVAAQHGYFANATNLSGFLSLILAVLLWPLVLLGVHLKI
jgi:polyferredoxin